MDVVRVVGVDLAQTGSVSLVVRVSDRMVVAVMRIVLTSEMSSTFGFLHVLGTGAA
ncbi:hypothetical protein VTJ49DRAFT_7008 [Mycothermus thermophilus]|uniref:Uncharacterized protein n=1 Tax=Humicola insolens TaxID=85995 RepID=A0ABR3V0L6_HUMIN